jgi:isopenicillin-N epimerase
MTIGRPTSLAGRRPFHNRPLLVAFAAVENKLWGPDWPEVRAQWPIDPAVAHLNHGSFGAVPTPVLEAQDWLRQQTEADPTGFFWWILPDALDRARREAAAFVHADPDGFVFLPNVTTAVNTVLASLQLGPGDEILLSDHVYGALRLAAERIGRLTGVSVTVNPVPLPAEGPDELTASVLAGVTSQTRLAIVEHIASPTALVFPIGDIVAGLREAGVPSLVDAAHGPGMLDIDVAALAPDFWTGNLHKWCCAPRGAAGFFVAEEHRERTVPLVTSWEAPKGFVPSFSWLGTTDYTAYLSVPAALAFMGRLGWDRVRRHNRELAALGRDIVRQAIGGRAEWSEGDGLFEAMTLVALPQGVVTSMDSGNAISQRLARGHRIEAAIFPWRDRGFLRLSAQAYNAPEEYERLGAALVALLRS